MIVECEPGQGPGRGFWGVGTKSLGIFLDRVGGTMVLNCREMDHRANTDKPRASFTSTLKARWMMHWRGM